MVSWTDIKYATKAVSFFRFASIRRYTIRLSKIFWLAREKGCSFSFWFLTHIYQVKNWLRTKILSAHVFSHILNSILMMTILALIFIVIIMKTEEHLASMQPSIESYFPDIIRPHIPSFTLKADAYFNLLGVISQLSGVFIGLYFTAITVLASTVYSKVPADIRSALIGEKINSTYFDVVLLSGVFSTLMFVLSVLGYQTGAINLLVVVVLFLTAMIGFSALAVRAFNFFDPTRLTEYIIAEIQQRIEYATPKGAFWRHNSFQNHYMKETAAYISTVKNIVLLAKREEFNFIDSKSLYAVGVRCLYLLQEYLAKKSSIPIDSFWFQRTTQNRSWFLANSTFQEISLNTNTPLCGENIVDYLWFEKALIEIFEIVIEILLKRNDSYILSISNTIGETSLRMGEKLAMNEAKVFLEVLRRISLSYIQRSEVQDSSKPEEASVAIVMADIYYLSLMSLLLGVSKKLSKIDEHYLTKLITDITWSKGNEVFCLDLPTPIISCLGKIRKKVLFEIEVDGKQISPQWYISQLVANEISILIKNAVESLTDSFDAYVHEHIGYMITNNKCLIASQAIQRGLEMCWKFNVHLPIVKNCYISINKLRTVSDIPCSTIEWEGIEKKLKQTEERLHINLGKILPSLALVQWNKELPDYFGFAYSILMQRCYDSLYDNDEKVFISLFPALFSTSISARARIISETQNSPLENRVALASGPILDIMELSGYAKIYSEIDGNNVWAQVEQYWNKFFDNSTDPSVLLALLLTTIDMKRGQLGLTPRDMLRTDWLSKLRLKLVEIDVIRDRFSEHIYTGDEEVKHKSAIIRSLCGDFDMAFHALDVFVATYLALKNGFDITNINWQTKHYFDELKREEKKEGDGNE